MNLERAKLIDSHAHVESSDYDADRGQVIQRTLDADIWMVNSGSSLESSKKVVSLAMDYESGVYATVGVHPMEAVSEIRELEIKSESEINGYIEKTIDALTNLIDNPKCVAIGECGMERSSDENYSSPIYRQTQGKLFIAQIELANKFKKPIVVHCRDAYDDVYSLIKEHRDKLLPDRPGLMHFFSGSQEQAERFLKMGFVFSFGGAITFPVRPNKTDFTSLIKTLPIEAILLETDSPYVSPVPLRGQRNEPLNVRYVAEKIAEIRRVGVEDIAQATTRNAMRLFAMDRPNR
jgi:TatD DNase family protein